MKVKKFINYLAMFTFTTLMLTVGTTTAQVGGGSTSGASSRTPLSTIQTRQPDTPAGVTATATSTSSIEISWYAVSGAAGYRVFRSRDSSGPFTLVGTTAETSLTNTNLSANTTYYYQVEAYNDAGLGAPGSTSATTLSPPPPPRFRFGFRGAYNLSSADVEVFYYTYYDWWGGNPSVHSTYSSGFNAGYEIGFVMNTRISPYWSFQTGVDFINRTPVRATGVIEHVNNSIGDINFEYKLSENVIAIPALIRVVGLSEEFTLFAEGGVQFEYVLTDIDDRNSFGIGYVGGLGFTIGRHIEIGGRVIFGMSDYVDVPEQSGSNLIQYSFGLTYMIKGK